MQFIHGQRIDNLAFEIIVIDHPRYLQKSAIRQKNHNQIRPGRPPKLRPNLPDVRRLPHPKSLRQSWQAWRL